MVIFDNFIIVFENSKIETKIFHYLKFIIKAMFNFSKDFSNSVISKLQVQEFEIE